MSVRGWNTRVVVATGVAMTGLLLVACGNKELAAGDVPAANVPTATASMSPTAGPTAEPADNPSEPGATAEPSKKPTVTPKPTPVKPFRLSSSMLLTGKEMAKGDPSRRWRANSQAPLAPICGLASTRGDKVQGVLSRHFTDELEADGGQWITRYSDERAARAAYNQIVATINSCKAFSPGQTHARKMTENRTVALGDRTRILRWYDYALPSDPGSENGGFPYAVTQQGKVVSVLAFSEMGTGIEPANFERIARSAAARLG
ncbi:hypothetical protein EV644_112182 [Kribbella orskensis]|uniref:PknH-like protein n=1 Tax=Kribbella orskensis TaxID=2512216 RepID=A0ABY2BFF4_9ACTN|nr:MULTISPECIES: hypothetical protein [Kribbella]TCN37009.1 hypothetical protein EV642_113181 [Kribbella sp. VKM Ac-2500]TCO18434.1 hypothetical protein EV644_112182 [Kribbella orskensis]